MIFQGIKYWVPISNTVCNCISFFASGCTVEELLPFGSRSLRCSCSRPARSRCGWRARRCSLPTASPLCAGCVLWFHPGPTQAALSCPFSHGETGLTRRDPALGTPAAVPASAGMCVSCSRVVREELLLLPAVTAVLVKIPFVKRLGTFELCCCPKEGCAVEIRSGQTQVLTALRRHGRWPGCPVCK